jgi:hypothetical protein
LHAAVEISKFFVSRLEASESGERHTHPFVPLWDFDAPASSKPLRNSSVGMIAANRFLLHQILIAEDRADEAKAFFDAAVRIMRETIEFALAEEKSVFEIPTKGGGEKFAVVKTGEGEHFDGILMHATANNNGDSHKIYADYYFLEAGNKSLRMGLM